MKLLGVPFETDHKDIRSFLSNGSEHHAEDMQRLFPGFLQCCVRAMKELGSRRVKVGRLEYTKGKITAYPSAEFPNEQPTEAFIYLLEKA